MKTNCSTFLSLIIVFLSSCSTQSETSKDITDNNDLTEIPLRNEVLNKDTFIKYEKEIYNIILELENFKYRITISESNKGDYVYKCWNLPSYQRGASLELNNGEKSKLGNNVIYNFKNQDYLYSVINNSNDLIVKKNDSILLKTKLYTPFKNLLSFDILLSKDSLAPQSDSSIKKVLSYLELCRDNTLSCNEKVNYQECRSSIDSCFIIECGMLACYGSVYGTLLTDKFKNPIIFIYADYFGAGKFIYDYENSLIYKEDRSTEILELVDFVPSYGTDVLLDAKNSTVETDDECNC